MTERINGLEGLDAFLAVLPDRASQQMQKAVRDSLTDHKDRVVQESTFKHLTDRQLHGMIHIEPRKTKRVADQYRPKRIEDVRGSIFMKWGGPEKLAKRKAARIEKRTGAASIKPKNARRLLIPMGDMVHPTTNRPRRTGKGKASMAIDLKTLPNTRFIKTVQGVFMIQELEAGEKGLHESHTDPDPNRARTKTGRRRKISKKKLGKRVRFLARVEDEAKQTRPLAFFGPWDSLEGSREARYREVLDEVLK